MVITDLKIWLFARSEEGKKYKKIHVRKLGKSFHIIHLMYALEGNSEFCFPENLNVSRDEVEGNIEIRGKTKFTISRGSIH